MWSKKQKETSKADRAIFALRELQETLHLLSPVEKSEVKAAHSFASAEWLDGLALACRPRSNEGSIRLAPLKNAISTPVTDLTSKEAEEGNNARRALTPDYGKLVLVLVGLPARGKSMLGKKLETFLSWRGYNTKGFSAGSRRRAMGAGGEDERPETGSASFFDSSKAYASMVREKVTIDTLEEALDWLTTDGGQVAIFDASNVSIQRRAKLKEVVRRRMEADATHQIGIVFVESIVTDPSIIQQGMDWKIAHSADFKGLQRFAALQDLEERIAHYEKIYETVREEEGPYIKLFNLRAKVHACNIYGRMSKSVLPYLLAIHSISRPVYMIAVGQQEDQGWWEGGGMTSKVEKWAAALSTGGGQGDLRILTSTHDRALQVAKAVSAAAKCPPPDERSQLAPVKDGPAPNATPNATPSKSFSGKFGERVASLVTRLEPIVLEIEAATNPLLIIAPEAQVRTLRSFLLPPRSTILTEREEVDVSVDVHESKVFVFTPKEVGGYEETRQEL